MVPVKSIPVLLLFSWIALAQANAYDWNAGVEYFSWREYTSCPQILEERGPRFFVGVESEKREHGYWEFGYSGKAYAALVVYDGFTQSCTPLIANSGYIGFTAEIDATRWQTGIPPESRMPQLGILAALGVDTWRRTIIDPGGYSEDYVVGLARFGIAARRGNQWTAEAGIKHPFVTYEVARLQDAGFSSDPLLHPKGAHSLFVNFRYRPSPDRSVRIYYASYRFNQSDPVTISSCPPSYTACSVHQPASHQDTIGFMMILNY